MTFKMIFKMKLIIVIVIIVVILFISFSLINILDFYKLSKNNKFIEISGGLNLDQGFYSLVEIIDFKNQKALKKLYLSPIDQSFDEKFNFDGHELIIKHKPENEIIKLYKNAPKIYNFNRKLFINIPIEKQKLFNIGQKYNLPDKSLYYNEIVMEFLDGENWLQEMESGKLSKYEIEDLLVQYFEELIDILRSNLLPQDISNPKNYIIQRLSDDKIKLRFIDYGSWFIYKYKDNEKIDDYIRFQIYDFIHPTGLFQPIDSNNLEKIKKTSLFYQLHKHYKINHEFIKECMKKAGYGNKLIELIINNNDAKNIEKEFAISSWIGEKSKFNPETKMIIQFMDEYPDLFKLLKSKYSNMKKKLNKFFEHIYQRISKISNLYQRDYFTSCIYLKLNDLSEHSKIIKNYINQNIKNYKNLFYGDYTNQFKDVKEKDEISWKYIIDLHENKNIPFDQINKKFKYLKSIKDFKLTGYEKIIVNFKTVEAAHIHRDHEVDTLKRIYWNRYIPFSQEFNKFTNLKSLVKLNEYLVNPNTIFSVEKIEIKNKIKYITVNQIINK